MATNHSSSGERPHDRTSRENHAHNTSGSPREKYRANDNDDERAPIPPEQRNDVKSDSRSEARGDQRETVGDTARGTATSPRGPEANDRTRRKPQS